MIKIIKKLVIFSYLILIVIVLGLAILIFYPKKISNPSYIIKINKGEGISTLLTKLKKDNIIYNQTVALSLAYFFNVNKSLHPGFIHIDSNRISLFNILAKLKEGPQKVYITIAEGKRYKEVKKYLDTLSTIDHKGANLDESELLNILNIKDYKNLEGIFFPDTYLFYEGVSDIDIYKKAYATMEAKLDKYWQETKDLPYRNKYDLLIIASLIEKESANIEDMGNIASVFINRINRNMLLQTDPTIIYALDEKYDGRLKKKDLQLDSAYNTYKYKGLPPTPIAYPSEASLKSAVYPNATSYIYFVSKMDGTGKSKFSKTLAEHNLAVKKYILHR